MIASPARFLLPLIAAGMLAFSGCGTYRNATAYFNTYYNASKLFDQAVAEVNKAPQPARDSNYFAPYRVPQATITRFEKVIEKGSKVIQFHGESGYVEDAIMMIGKAYLYQNETESAAGKFRELLENFPGSGYREEATLWYAKALYQGKNDDQALAVLKELTAPAAEGEDRDVSDDVLLEGRMLEAQIYADRGEYAESATALEAINELGGDSELKAIAQYQLGSVYELTEEYERAAGAFGRVGDFGPTPTMSFNAKLRQGVMLSLSGDPDAALETFDELIGWPLKNDQSALVDLEIANAYWTLGDSAAAFTLYDIIDSTYKRTDAAARSFFKRASIFETEYRNMDSAMVYYRKAKSEYPSSPVTPTANARFTSLDHFIKTRDRLAKDEGTLAAMLAPADTSAAGDTTGTEGAADAAPAARDSAGRGRGIFGLGLDPSAKPSQVAGENPPAGGNQARLRPAPGGPVEILSMRIIRSRPRHLVPDPEDPGDDGTGGAGEDGPESPESAIAGRMNDGGATGSGNKAAAAPVQKAPSSPEEVRQRIAEGEYELGGIFLLDLDLPDSALVHYHRLVEEQPESPLVAKTFYAMSEAHRILGDTVSVDSLYDLLLARHPETEYARQVRIVRDLDTAAAVESRDEQRYRRSEEALFAGEAQRALDSLRRLCEEATDTAVAPKARYAVGWIYENVLIDLDSAEAWYKSLIEEYPSSVYALNANPRVVVRGDTSKVGQFVKFKKIEAVPKPQRKALGQVPVQQATGKGAPPGLPADLNKPPTNPDDDEYFDPGPDEDDEEQNAEPDDEPEESDDDPGRTSNP